MTLDLDIEIKAILDDYAVEVQKDIEDAAKTTAQFGARELRKTSPKDKGDYAKGWGYRKEGKGLGETSYVVYNKSHPGLTHLLEKGHLIRNQYGSYGRTKAIPHIKPVEMAVSQRFIEEITKRIKK
jgi:hypothetical protein